MADASSRGWCYSEFLETIHTLRSNVLASNCNTDRDRTLWSEIVLPHEDGLPVRAVPLLDFIARVVVGQALNLAQPAHWLWVYYCLSTLQDMSVSQRRRVGLHRQFDARNADIRALRPTIDAFLAGSDEKDPDAKANFVHSALVVRNHNLEINKLRAQIQSLDAEIEKSRIAKMLDAIRNMGLRGAVELTTEMDKLFCGAEFMLPS